MASINRIHRLSVLLLVGAVLAAASGTAPRSSAAVTTPLDGRWTATITRAQLRRAGASATLAAKLYGSFTAVYKQGRFQFRHRGGGESHGTFSVRGNVARLVFQTGIGLQAGHISQCTFSVYRDRLTFKPIPGRRSLLCDAGVWVRAR